MDAWAVLTTDLRILCLSSLEDVTRAARAKIITPQDLVFPPTGEEFAVGDLIPDGPLAETPKSNQWDEHESASIDSSVPTPQQRAAPVSQVAKRTVWDQAEHPTPPYGSFGEHAEEVEVDEDSFVPRESPPPAEAEHRVAVGESVPGNDAGPHYRPRPVISSETVAMLDDLLWSRTGRAPPSRIGGEARRKQPARVAEIPTRNGLPRAPLRPRPKNAARRAASKTAASTREGHGSGQETPQRSANSAPYKQQPDGFAGRRDSNSGSPTWVTRERTEHGSTPDSFGPNGRWSAKSPKPPQIDYPNPAHTDAPVALSQEPPASRKVVRPRLWQAALVVVILGSLVVGKLMYSPESAAVAPAASVEQRSEMTHELAKAEVVSDLRKKLELLEAQIATDADNPELLREYAKAANQLADQEWVRVWANPLSKRASLNKERLVALSRDALWAADRYLKAEDSVDAKTEQLNALRCAGRLDRALAIAEELDDEPPTPALHYALGALALANPLATPTHAIQHLEAAADFDAAPGTVRSALILAYLRAGHLVDAERELEVLHLLVPSHPAAQALSELLAGLRKTHSDDEEPKKQQPKQKRVKPPSTADLLVAAKRARNRNALERARELYHFVLAGDSRNCQALSGLGTLAIGKGSFNVAESYLRAAQEANGQCAAAEVGLADLLWAQGKRAEARQSYRAIVKANPSAKYPDHVADRLADP